MRYILTSFVATLIATSAFAANTCEEQLQEIKQTQTETHAIKIPDLTYTVSKENCAKVQPTLEAVEEIGPKLVNLKEQFENYYQTCDRSMDVIYAIEEAKINIVLMQTMRELAESLAVECGSNN